MKKINIFIFTLLLILTACDYEQDQLFDNLKETPVAPILTVEGASNIVMKKVMPDMYVTSLNWSRANYGKGVVANYTLEVSDTDTFDGELLKIAIGDDVYTKTLNAEHIIDWAKHFNAYDEATEEVSPMTFYLRIMATAAEGNVAGVSEKTAVSNTESISITQFDEPIQPWDKELTIKFKAISGDWGKYAVYAHGESEVYGGWPGQELEADEDGWYAFVVPVNRPINLIINNNGDGKQFDFLSNPETDACYELAIGEENNDCEWTEVDCPTKYPTALYMIGEEFGNWSWGSEGVAVMTPVWGFEGHFWAVRHISADKGFKWNSVRDWGGDFCSLGEDLGFTTSDGNAFVDKDGMYMVYIDMTSGKISIEEAKVYGMGDCFGGWDMGNFPFTAEGNTMTYTTTGGGELRIYATSTIAPIGGDWWKMEFVPIDGVIQYRGNGDDQTRVPVEAGKKITLDFNAGTAAFE